MLATPLYLHFFIFLFQPQVPLRLPCYNLTKVSNLELSPILLLLHPILPPTAWWTVSTKLLIFSPWPSFHWLLTIPSSLSRFTDLNPYFDNFYSFFSPVYTILFFCFYLCNTSRALGIWIMTTCFNPPFTTLSMVSYSVFPEFMVFVC